MIEAANHVAKVIKAGKSIRPAVGVGHYFPVGILVVFPCRVTQCITLHNAPGNHRAIADRSLFIRIVYVPSVYPAAGIVLQLVLRGVEIIQCELIAGFAIVFHQRKQPTLIVMKLQAVEWEVRPNGDSFSFAADTGLGYASASVD